MKKETILRTVVLFTALLNQLLTALGKNPLPFSEDQIYGGLSAVCTVLLSVWAWWKNNSFTKKAIEADAYLAELREKEKEAQ